MSSPQTSPPVTGPATPAPMPGPGLVLCPDWEALCNNLATSLGTASTDSSGSRDPFASQLVVADQPAARRRLSQELALRDGICAGVSFTSLRGLRRLLEDEVLGVAAGTDPWRGRGLALAVLDVMGEVAHEEWFTPVAHHLGQAADRPGRRLATADRIASLYLRYARTRPELVRAWNRGEACGPDGAPLAHRARWQPRLWALVRARLAADRAPLDPVARHEQLLDALAAHDAALLAGTDHAVRLVDPNPCLPLDRELVAALAARAPVTVWALAGAQGDGAPGDAAQPGRPDRPLERWARSRRVGIERWQQVATHQEALASSAAEPATLLTALQASISGQAGSGQDFGGFGDARRPDRSVQVHASHGPDRQVEVLRELLCGLFADDPTLEPRDVLVACTDLDAYAPLVRAAFCLDPDVLGANLHPGHQLRVQLSDASLGQPNQVLETLRLVLQLANDRASAEDLVGLCASRPVATLFGLGEDDLERIRRLVGQADVRWGLDARHRDGFGLGQVRQSTWLAGVERVLVGIAMGSQPLRWIGTALPVDQVDSSDVMAAGALAEIVSRTRKLVAEWRTPAPVGQWVERLGEALTLLTATSPDDAWQLAQARGELADLADLTLDRTALLALGDVQALFARLLRTGRGRPNFGNGSLLVCGLDDVASVPHRVVVVLGLDDHRFPAHPTIDGDDLTLANRDDPELDPRARSRQQLLDAVLAARQTLAVVHQGFTPRTNEPVPQPVAVIDLLDACRALGEPLVLQHSLQPQSWKNFSAEPGEPPLSFDAAALHGAQAHELLLDDPPPPRTPLHAVALAAPAQEESLDVGALLDFYRHPARELLRRTLGVTMGERDEQLADELPIEPNGLQEWAIGERMVRLALNGMPPQQVSEAERLRGELPPGQLGSRTLGKLLPVVGRIVDAGTRERQVPARDLDCELELPAGCGADLLTARVRLHGASIVNHTFSRTNAAHLLAAWFDLLVVSATQPAPPTGWRAVHIGRDAIATLVAPPPQRSATLLAELVRVRSGGLSRLVPLPIRTASEFTGVVPLRPYGQHDPEASARKSFGYEHDADWARFLSDDFEALRAIPALPGDPGTPGPSRFENLADWLFAPIKAQLAVGNLR